MKSGGSYYQYKGAFKIMKPTLIYSCSKGSSYPECLLPPPVAGHLSIPVERSREHWAQIVAEHFLHVLVEEEAQPEEYLHMVQFAGEVSLVGRCRNTPKISNCRSTSIIS